MSGDLNGFVVLGVLWFLVSILTRGKLKSPRPPQPLPRRKPPQTSLPTGLDRTQREGVRLEVVLRQLGRALEEAAQTEAPRSEPAEVSSLEQEVRREVRQPVDLEDEAITIEARRIEAAVARNTGQAAAPQAKPEQRPAQQPADHTRAVGYTARQLRDAVVWREILDPPLSLRGERGGPE